jgi:hypothetical protein
MPEIGLSGSMSGEWKRDLRAPAPFLDSTGHPAQTAAAAAENPQTQSNQECAKQNADPYPDTARNAACPCGSGKKYKRCCGVDAPPVLYAA